MKKNLANIITLSRLVGTFALLFTNVLSARFFLIYIWCGVSDVLDGYVARTLKTTSTLGSKLDSISDLSFYTVMMIMIFRHLRKYLPHYVWILIYLAVGVRALCYVAVGLHKGCFESRHTVFNKITSFMMFFLPFVVESRFLTPYSLMILLVAFVSNFEEIIYIAQNWDDKDQTLKGA